VLIGLVEIARFRVKRTNTTSGWGNDGPLQTARRVLRSQGWRIYRTYWLGT